MNYEDRVAFRHSNGQVEGFAGIGATKAKARADSIDQIQKKLKIVAELGTKDTFSKSRLITRVSDLKGAELDKVQCDWRSGLRY